MARVCAASKRRPSTGNNVSHSNRKTKRVFDINLVTKTFFHPETGQKFRAKVTTKALKTLLKNPRKMLDFAREMCK